MKISIIIPIYNEEKTVINILEKINFLDIWNENKHTKEIIIINDGSTDNSIDVLKKNYNLYDKLIDNKINKGKGSAVREGILDCSGDYVIFQDADNEYDPEDYVKFIKCVEKFSADFVIGNRFNYDKYTRSHNFLNKVGNWLITFFFNIIYNTTFSDIYCCYIFFKRELLEIDKIKSDGFEQHAEILCNLKKNGNRFYEVPVNYNGRNISEGKKIRYYHIFSIFFQILKSRFFS
jgi:glycosyltransferase involved in cell wall biosynthesis